MNPSWESIVVGGALFATMAAYALFAGADFGGGIWDLLAGTTKQGEKPRAAIDRSVTPVWEGNQVWIVLGIVFVWTGFPTAFAAIMTSLFVPLSLSLLGILLRGIGFAFRHEAQRLRTQQLAGVLFAASSLIAPFFLGATVGAVASGRVHTDTAGNVTSAWVNPTALVTGALFLAACAYIGGVYLVGDSHRRGDEQMTRYFSRRAIAAGLVTGALAGVNLLLLRSHQPYLFHRLTGVALPLVIVSVLGGLGALVLILLRRQWLLRLSAAVAVAAVVAAWGVAQYPYILPGTLTLEQGSAPNAALLAEFVVIGLAAILVVPSFAYLYWLQQHGRLEVSEPSDGLRLAVAAQNQPAAAGQAAVSPHPVVTAVILAAAAVELLRDTVARIRHRRTRAKDPRR
jgi:cytochrome d ubiquinol oxidase subunit II